MSEPVLIGLTPTIIVGLLASLANLGRTFGIAITQEQVDAINNIVPQLMLVLTLLGGWYARKRSTSVAAPTLPQGTSVTVVTPEGQPNTQTVL